MVVLSVREEAGTLPGAGFSQPIQDLGCVPVGRKHLEDGSVVGGRQPKLDRTAGQTTWTQASTSGMRRRRRRPATYSDAT
jgi:hypothetical protein